MKFRNWKWIWVFLSVYWVLGNLVLNTSYLRDEINTWDEGFVDYQWAFTIIPSIVHIGRFEIRHQDKNIQWKTEIRQVNTGINLFALLNKKFQTYFILGDGVDFEFGVRKHSKNHHSPEFPGIPEKPKKRDPKPTEKKQGWRLALHHIHLNNLEKAWVDEIKFEGSSELAGSFEIIPDKEVWVGPARWHVFSGKVQIGDKPLFSEFSAQHVVTIKPFDPNSPKVDDLEFLNISSQLQTKVSSLDFLNYYFRNIHWLKGQNISSNLIAHLQVTDGKLAPGTALKIEPGEVNLEFLKHRLNGTAKIEGNVLANHANLSLEMDDFAIFHKGQKPDIVGKRLEIKAKSDSTAIASLFSHLDVDVLLKDAKAPDLTLFNQYIPSPTSLKFLEGYCTLNASLKASTKNFSDRGVLNLETHHAKVQFEKTIFTGKFALEAKLKKGNLHKKTFDISGTRLNILDVAAVLPERAPQELQTSNWWSEVKVPQGNFQLGAPLRFNGKVVLNVRDLRPVLAVYMRKHSLPDIVQDILAKEKLQASTQVKLNGDEVSLSKFKIFGDDLQISANLRFLDREKQAVLLAKYGVFAVALERSNEDTRIILHEAEKWYENHSTFIPYIQ